MLAVHSAVFRAMFSHSNTKEATSGVVEIKDASAAAVRALVRFCNGGRVEQHDVAKLALELFVLADRYQMPNLLVCVQRLKSLSNFSRKFIVEALLIATLRAQDGSKRSLHAHECLESRL